MRFVAVANMFSKYQERDDGPCFKPRKDAAVESVIVELKTKPADAVLTGAGDMVKLNPDACNVEKDNEYVRITRVKLPPHGKLAMHSHPTNVVVYVSGGHSKATTADGKSQESTIAPGTVKVSRPIEHSNENLDDKPTEAVVVELKTAAK